MVLQKFSPLLFNFLLVVVTVGVENCHAKSKFLGSNRFKYFLLLECTPTPLTVPSNILLAHKHTCRVDEVIQYVRAVAVKYCKGQCCWTRQHCLITFSSTKHTLFDYLSLTRIFLNEVYVLCFSVDLLFPLAFRNNYYL